MMFETAHRDFLNYHEARRTGERARRLRDGHGHAEQEFLRHVWWPAFKSLRRLHPEYEIFDFDGRRRFLDFAYFPPGNQGREKVKLAIEIDGFTSHVTQLSRADFTNQLKRQNHLILDNWTLLRFSYDQVTNEPRYCQRVLQQFMGQRPQDDYFGGLTITERAVVELARDLKEPLAPSQITNLLGIDRKTAYRLLRRLVAREWLEPVRGQKRIRSYRLHPGRSLGE